MVDEVDHTHGDTGTKPSQSLNFQDGDYPDPEEFDWFWSQVPSAINDHADLLASIDSNEDGIVDKAENAQALGGESPSYYATDANLDSHESSTSVHGVTTVAGQSYVDNELATHAADGSVHHARYDDNEAVSAIESADEVVMSGTLDLSDGYLILPVGQDQYPTQ